MLLQFRTLADLRAPTDAQLANVPRAQWVAAQQKLLDTLRGFIVGNTGKATQRQKLQLLAMAVLPLAQCQLMLGTPRDVVIEHATELLEANFLQDALDETSGLLRWFAE